MLNLKFAARLWWAGYKSWLKANRRNAVILGAVALFLGSCAGQAFGADAVLSWTTPTQYTDGSALSKCPSQTSTGDCLKGFRVYRGDSAASLAAVQDLNDRNATGYTFTNLPKGTHYFAVTAYTGAGVESAKSNIPTKVIVGTPNPPVLTVVETTAYRMRQSVDGFEFLALGTVPLGTVCDEREVAGYHMVPREAVTLANRFDTKPLTVWAKCSAG